MLALMLKNTSICNRKLLTAFEKVMQNNVIAD